MGDQRSWAGQLVVAVASNTRTGPARRRRVRASAANSSRSGLVVLHSSAPGAASTLCTRSARDLPVWVGARVPVGLVSGEHMRPIGPRCSGAATSVERGAGAVAGGQPGAGPPCGGPGRGQRQLAADLAAAGMPGGGGAPAPPAEPDHRGRGGGGQPQQHRRDHPVDDGVPGERRPPRRAEVAARVVGVGEDPHTGGDPPVGGGQLHRGAEQGRRDPRGEDQQDGDDHRHRGQDEQRGEHEQVAVGDRGQQLRARPGHRILTSLPTPGSVFTVRRPRRRGRGSRAAGRPRDPGRRPGGSRRSCSARRRAVP